MARFSSFVCTGFFLVSFLRSIPLLMFFVLEAKAGNASSNTDIAESSMRQDVITSTPGPSYTLA